MALAKKPGIAKLSVVKDAAEPAPEKPREIKRKTPGNKKLAAKKAIRKTITSTAEAIEEKKIEDTQEPVVLPRKRGRPAGMTAQPCPYCSKLCVRKGVREYQNAGGKAARFHCNTPDGCHRYHLRNPETSELIDIPEEKRRKAPSTLGKKRLTPNTLSVFITTADDVLEVLKQDENNISVAEAFGAALEDLRDKLAPHLQPSIVQMVDDALDNAVEHFEVTPTTGSEYLTGELKEIVENGLKGLSKADRYHLESALDKLPKIFAVVNAARNRAESAKEAEQVEEVLA